ncbi:MAG: HAMP domain-containing protein [Deltaproteobacteria bacterium]|nr:HAMP domain-containing protein [Deltaproteobacteria bacterium]MBI4223542.1 HAMP domain-containing protein [Deltaproteobacteria bacterium]
MKRRDSIAYKLSGLLGAVILLMGMHFAFSFYFNVQTQGFLEQTQMEMEFLKLVKEFRDYFNHARKEEKNWFLFRSQNYLQSRQKFLVRAQNSLADLKKKTTDPHLTERVGDLENHLLHYATLNNELPGIQTVSQTEAFTQKARAVDEGVMEQIAEITNALLEKADHNQELADLSLQKYFLWFIPFSLLGLTLWAVAGFWVLYRLKKRLFQLVEATRRMAMADYAPQLDTAPGDELGLLAAHFNEMAGKIAEREAKINQISQELIQANNLLKKGRAPFPAVSKIRP